MDEEEYHDFVLIKFDPWVSGICLEKVGEIWVFAELMKQWIVWLIYVVCYWWKWKHLLEMNIWA
jgi:hypothetical protein